MAAISPSRFTLGSTAWVVILAVLILVVAAMVIYLR